MEDYQAYLDTLQAVLKIRLGGDWNKTMIDELFDQLERWLDGVPEEDGKGRALALEDATQRTGTIR